MRIGPFIFTGSTSHWVPNGTSHGPQSNPRLFAARLIRLRTSARVPNCRLWLYFRGGYALHAEAYFDRRRR